MERKRAGIARLPGFLFDALIISTISIVRQSGIGLDYGVFVDMICQHENGTPAQSA
jgi:hypothetical protein